MLRLIPSLSSRCLRTDMDGLALRNVVGGDEAIAIEQRPGLAACQEGSKAIPALPGPARDGQTVGRRHRAALRQIDGRAWAGRIEPQCAGLVAEDDIGLSRLDQPC